MFDNIRFEAAQAAVPEPSSLLLACAGALLFCAKRGRRLLFAWTGDKRFRRVARCPCGVTLNRGTLTVSVLWLSGTTLFPKRNGKWASCPLEPAQGKKDALGCGFKLAFQIDKSDIRWSGLLQRQTQTNMDADMCALSRMRSRHSGTTAQRKRPVINSTAPEHCVPDQMPTDSPRQN